MEVMLFDEEALFERKNQTAHELRGSRLRLSWQRTALNLAFDIAGYRSEDPYTQVGACVLKHEGFEVGLGYNGPPSGVDIEWFNREEKNEFVLHAEHNVLNRIVPGEARLIAVTHLPCEHCIKTIKQKGIDEVVYCIVMNKYNPEKTFKLAKKYGIVMIQMNPTTKNAPNTLEYKG